MTPYVWLLALVGAMGSLQDEREGLGGIPPLRSSRSLLALSTILAVAVIGALRWRVGTDYWAYEAFYPEYVQEAARTLDLLGEPGVRWIAWVSSLIHDDPATFFAVTSLITVLAILGTTWKWTCAVAFSAVLFILTGVWTVSFNAVRQYLAIAVLVAGHQAIVNRRLLRWIAIVLAASLFHVSALFGLLFYFVPTRRLSWKGVLAAGALGIATLYAWETILTLLMGALGRELEGEGAYSHEQLHPLRVGLAVMPIVLALVLPSRAGPTSRSGHLYVNLTVLHGISVLAASQSALLARFSLYPQAFLPLGLAYITQGVRNTAQRTLVRLILVVIYGLFFAFEISVTANLRDFRWLWERR